MLLISFSEFDSNELKARLIETKICGSISQNLLLIKSNNVPKASLHALLDGFHITEIKQHSSFPEISFESQINKHLDYPQSKNFSTSKKSEYQHYYKEKMIREASIAYEKYCNDTTPRKMIWDEDWNEIQKSILAIVSEKKLMDISVKPIDNHEKVKQMLELFGFNSKKNGYNYIVYSISILLEHPYHSLDAIAVSISKKYGGEPAEIKRIIIARIKETLNFKYSVAINFLRLIAKIVWKGLNKNETTN